ncbi:MAG: alkyldihydroxyacetonephosphate synthase [Solirubrobacteraceae bacterium]|nr:alkyldihydroxyacetonephosphate synthase [Solirubrobacteraceae bacterium]
MRWWGWGEEGRAPALGPAALSFLADTLELAPRPSPPVALSHVVLAPSRLTDRAGAQLREVVGDGAVRDDHGERVLHAAGKGYPDLVRLRAGTPDGAPDVVVLPGSAEQVAAVLALCARESLAVVPFGGGTSVVGGVAPYAGSHAGVVCLDTARLDDVVELDRESQTVTVGGGMRAPALERSLARHGLTLGHYPQSFEYVSLGGCAATRSAGQASSGYGAIERMVVGLRMTAPAGEIELPPMPASAAGPSLRQTLVGSEGTLGVITELSLRVRAAPGEQIYEGVFFEDLSAGVQALRALAQHGAAPDVARLSDEPETRMSLALAGSGGLKGALGRLYLGARGYRDGCLAILGFEGGQEEVGERRRRALALVRAHGGLAVGRSPGEAWRHGRFAAPYLRDELLTLGVMVETLETATQWSNLLRLHGAVSEAINRALRDGGTPGLVMCHVSHLYETGASLYFTFLARQREEDPIDQWLAVKRVAGDAIVAAGGTITHHHAVGRDHTPWMRAEVGDLGLSALRALKAELDPAGVMNPGKLLDDQPVVGTRRASLEG